LYAWKAPVSGKVLSPIYLKVNPINTTFMGTWEKESIRGIHMQIFGRNALQLHLSAGTSIMSGTIMNGCVPGRNIIP
jgi:hypothetical protein